MVTIPSFYKFRNSEFIQYQTDLQTIITSYDAQSVQLSDPLAALEAQTTAMDQVYKKQLGSDITKLLEQSDRRRDTAIIGLRAIAEAYTYHYELPQQEAGQLLVDSIRTYGNNIARQNYPTQTTTLRTLLQLWDTDTRYSDAISTLGLNAWVAELEQSNTAFADLYLERNASYAEDSSTSVTILRSETKEAYTVLIDHIKAHALLNASATYEQLIKELNTLTEQYNALVEKRSGSIEDDPVSDISDQTYIDPDQPTTAEDTIIS